MKWHLFGNSLILHPNQSGWKKESSTLKLLTMWHTLHTAGGMCTLKSYDNLTLEQKLSTETEKNSYFLTEDVSSLWWNIW